MIVQPDAGFDRAALIAALGRHGVECRPIVAGNFAKNDVVKHHMAHVIHDQLRHADDIDRNGLFIGNHHYPVGQAMGCPARSAG